MLDAGRYFLNKQQRSFGVSEKELIRIAILSMGLNELGPFVPEERIIEYLLRNPADEKLVRMSLRDFADETASESPAPGGGSIAAYVGALGAALGGMVANLSAHKKGWDSRWAEFGDWAAQGQRRKDELLRLVDADTRAFNAIMSAFGLPKGNEEEKKIRHQAIQSATKTAIEVPFHVMETAYASLELIKAMAAGGNPNSVSDAGVGALCVRAAVHGAFLNVRINASGYEDKNYVAAILSRGQMVVDRTDQAECEILAIVSEKIGG
jgi:glutamate formiminotransferase/formiminotetrahydrofolate cyclodeaminase